MIQGRAPMKIWDKYSISSVKYVVGIVLGDFKTKLERQGIFNKRFWNQGLL